MAPQIGKQADHVVFLVQLPAFVVVAHYIDPRDRPTTVVAA